MTNLPDDPKKLSRERYDQFAEGYVTSETHAKGAELQRLVEIAEPNTSWAMLDVATGGGHTALKFAPHVSTVVASDLTPNMLAQAQKFIEAQGAKNVSFEIADAEDLPFEDTSFDLVTCRIAPHHFPNIEAFVQEAHRVLKTSGILLIQDHVLSKDGEVARYADHFERLRDPSHNRAYSEEEWRTAFRAAGFTVQHAEQLTKRHQVIPWAERQGNDAEMIAELQRQLQEAPPAVAEWMQIEKAGTPDASFVNHHIIIKGRKL